MSEKAARLIFHHTNKAALVFGFSMATDFSLRGKWGMMRVSGWPFHYSLFPPSSSHPSPDVIFPSFIYISTSLDGSLCYTERHSFKKFFSCKSNFLWGSNINSLGWRVHLLLRNGCMLRESKISGWNDARWFNIWESNWSILKSLKTVDR